MAFATTRSRNVEVQTQRVPDCFLDPAGKIWLILTSGARPTVGFRPCFHPTMSVTSVALSNQWKLSQAPRFSLADGSSWNGRVSRTLFLSGLSAAAWATELFRIRLLSLALGSTHQWEPRPPISSNGLHARHPKALDAGTTTKLERTLENRGHITISIRSM